MKPSEVLVTGGTGTLGLRVVERLRFEGREVRVMSRGGQPGTVKGDLLTGEGVEEAVRGVDTIVHCASGHRKTRQTDVEGTEFLLRKAAQAGVSHVVFISIVGVDRNPFFYYRIKLATENVVERSPVPWTILRSTQFHDLMLKIVGALSRVPFAAPIPKSFLFQPIDAGEVADRLVEQGLSGPAGRVPDVGGSQARTLANLARSYLVKPWLKKQWCIPELSAEFVWRMEDVLDLYEEPYDPNKPVLCFEELPYQMVAEKRRPLAQKPGRPQRYDYEYERKGMLNIFAFFEANSGWRHLDITERRTAVDFALAMRRLVDELYPTTEKVRVVLDNLNTHSPASLYKAFEPEEARRLLHRLEFHHTPKHASWLNMVEIELSVLSRQCLERRIPDAERLTREIGAWEHKRNEGGATVQWRFTASDAREKLARLYPAQP